MIQGREVQLFCRLPRTLEGQGYCSVNSGGEGGNYSKLLLVSSTLQRLFWAQKWCLFSKVFFERFFIVFSQIFGSNLECKNVKISIKIEANLIFFFQTIFSSNLHRILSDFGVFFNDFFMHFSFGKGMRSRKADSVKIVLTLEREHENQGLRGYETCSKTTEIDVKTHAKSCMRFGSDF